MGVTGDLTQDTFAVLTTIRIRTLYRTLFCSICVLIREVPHALFKSLHTLTCSLDVMAQNTISAKFCVGKALKHIPPMTRSSLMRASEWCLLQIENMTVWINECMET